MKRLVPALFLVLSACAGQAAPPVDAEGAEGLTEEGIRAHLRFLSHDLLDGRAPGSRGGDIAGHYIASRFEAAGLQPVEGSFFQPVPMIGSTPLAEALAARFSFRGQSASPDYLDDFVIWSGDAGARSSAASGELVFAGYGVLAPEAEWNDFGTDVSGKILLILVNDPPPTAEEPDRFEGDAMTYYGRWTYKFEEAARQGAAGAFIVHTTEAAGYPWSVVRSSWSGEQFSLPSPGDIEPLAIEGWLTFDAAADILRMAELDLEELMEQAARRDFSAIPTGISVDARVSSETRTVETMNVVGLLPGSERPDEVITVTSHYDHLGVGPPVDGDSIYNGAYDNASGVAVLLEVAGAFAALGTPPARSLLFIATAAEEAGLLGASWYTQSPLFPLAQTVATINIDGANLWGEADDYVAQGGERNELGAYVERRAAEMGITLVPDPEPEKGYFFRSDHFPFALAGVPALYIEHGQRFRGRPEGWGEERMAEYVAERYHAPGDEFSEDFVFDGAVQHATLLFRTAYDIAMDSTFPNWFEGSEFRPARDRMRAPE